MKIALIGFGAMGKAIKRIALERGHEILSIIDPHDNEANFPKISAEALNGCEAAIDFSHKDALQGNLETCQKCGVNLIIGTTGWYEKLPEIKSLVENKAEAANEIGFLWSSNFSIGVNVYFKIVEAAAKLMNDFDEYDIWGHEIHHCNKADSPSGTAKTLEKILLENISRKTSAVEEKLDRKREPNEIHFSSVRGGLVNFGHTVGFDSAADTITLSHSARNRDGYALGAVKAAEWLIGKKGYFEMQDFLNNFS